jgi:hypothetical protein
LIFYKIKKSQSIDDILTLCLCETVKIGTCSDGKEKGDGDEFVSEWGALERASLRNTFKEHG